MFLLIGVLIGLVLGLTGAGGSVFAVPLLILLGGLSISDAVGLSLGAVAASTLYGSLSRLKSQVLWMPAVLLAATGALTAPLGKWLGTLIPELWLLSGFSVLATVIALHMWFSARRNPAAASVVRAGNFSDTEQSPLLCRMSTTGQFELRPRCLSGLLGGGLTVGLMSGLFGVGGGFLIVPLLLFLSQVSMVQAVSTSLVVITVVSGAGFASHLALSYGAGAEFAWPLLGLLVLGGVLGMVAGQRLSGLIANARLQQIFAVSLVTVSLAMLVFSFLM